MKNVKINFVFIILSLIIVIFTFLNVGFSSTPPSGGWVPGMEKAKIYLTDNPQKIEMVKEWLRKPESGYPDLVNKIKQAVEKIKEEAPGYPVPLDLIHGRYCKLIDQPENAVITNHDPQKVCFAYLDAWYEKNPSDISVAEQWLEIKYPSPTPYPSGTPASLPPGPSDIPREYFIEGYPEVTDDGMIKRFKSEGDEGFFLMEHKIIYCDREMGLPKDSRKINQVKEWIRNTYTSYPYLAKSLRNFLKGREVLGCPVPINVIHHNYMQSVGKKDSDVETKHDVQKLKEAFYKTWREKNPDIKLEAKTFEEIAPIKMRPKDVKPNN